MCCFSLCDVNVFSGLYVIVLFSFHAIKFSFKLRQFFKNFIVVISSHCIHKYTVYKTHADNTAQE